MDEKKPYYKQKKWRIGGSFGWWSIPFCPHCKRHAYGATYEVEPKRREKP